MARRPAVRKVMVWGLALAAAGVILGLWMWYQNRVTLAPFGSVVSEKVISSDLPQVLRDLGSRKAEISLHNTDQYFELIPPGQHLDYGPYLIYVHLHLRSGERNPTRITAEAVVRIWQYLTARSPTLPVNAVLVASDHPWVSERKWCSLLTRDSFETRRTQPGGLSADQVFSDKCPTRRSDLLKPPWS